MVGKVDIAGVLTVSNGGGGDPSRLNRQGFQRCTEIK